MDRRKRIGLFMAHPETTHARRILTGITSQCDRYGYDLCVFSPSIHLSFPHEDYVRGESNIFRLANPAELDGIIVDSVSLVGDPGDQISKQLYERILGWEGLPKCAMELPVKGMALIKSNNEEAIRAQVRHAVEVHGRKRLCILTGHQGNEIAEARLALYLDEARKYGLDVLPEHIIYGDFYYFSGDALARKIAAKEIPPMDAVICASDFMAMGLLDRLNKLDIRVPEDLLVIGFDSSDEGAINQTTVASFEPADMEMGANAVDYLRGEIDPGADIQPFRRDLSARFHAGASCGCQTDPAYAMKRFRNSLYLSTCNQADEEQRDLVGVGTFLESYAMEGFTASKTSEECFKNIFNYSDLLKPYRNFYLCLKKNWQDTDDILYEGYPEEMRVFIASSRIGDEAFYGEENAVSFPIDDLLPALHRAGKPGVFYFSPVHFDGVLLGYSVLERDLRNMPVINTVYKQWLRYVNNALEMTRAKERLEILSARDTMTGAFNRRGMYAQYRSLLQNAREGDALMVCVVDMDGLKYVNDTFGHGEGDFGIKAVCRALQSVAKKHEFIVRSGGDEFFLIGIGPYEKGEEAQRTEAFLKAVEKTSENANKPYRISASIGCVIFEDCRQTSLDNALSEADIQMYRYKVQNKKHRGIQDSSSVVKPL